MAKRRWLEGVVIAIAAVASIATSRPRWSVPAKLPADDPAKPRVFAVEASQAPELYLAGDQHVANVHAMPDGAPWTGSGTYFVPAGVTVQEIAVRGHCNGGMCSKCKAPDGTFVKVASVTEVAAWRVEVDGPEHAVGLSPTTYSSTHVNVKTDGIPRLRLDGAAVVPTVRAYRGGFEIVWPAVEQERTITFTPHVIVEGACPSTAPCTAPADAIAIEKVENRSFRR